MALQPPELMEELMEEILLRLPTNDPASHVRAALVCKLWCRLVSGTAFRRRFREFHRSAGAAPLLGVIYTGNCKLGHHDDDDDPSRKPIRSMQSPMAAYYVPTNGRRRIVRAPDGGDWLAVDARHGRVLLYKLYIRHTIGFSVWNPVTNEQRHMPELPYNMCHDYTSAVVCASAAGGGNCDHLDCHRGPFLVVAMDILSHVMKLSVYSSEAGAWSQLTDFKLPLPRRLGFFAREPIVLAGSALYLLVRIHDEVLKYDLATQEVSAIPLPSEIRHLKRRIELVTDDDDGEIGFVSNKRWYKLVSNREPAKGAASTSSANVPVPPPKRRRTPNPKYAGPTWTA